MIMVLFRLVAISFIAIFCGQLSGLSAQPDPGEVYKLWAIPNTSPKAKTQPQWTGNPSIDNLFNQFNVTEYTKAFPYSDNNFLQQVYRIKCQNCSLENLKDSIENVAPNYFQRIEERKFREPKKLGSVDPDDWWWWASENKDGWMNPDILWHLKKIDASKAWGITKGKSDVVTALIDTDFNLEDNTGHVDLKDEFINSPKEDPYSGEYFKDPVDDPHGTWVAGLISAETNEYNAQGPYPSIGFNTSMLGYTTPRNFLKKAHHAAIQKEVEVLTSSVLINECPADNSKIERNLVSEILNSGTTVIRPAGNGPDEHVECDDLYEGTDYQNASFPLSPYYDERIVIVSGATRNDNHTNPNGPTHSHYPSVDLLSPDYDLLTTKPSNYDPDKTDETLDGADGTSFSTPIVAGVASLMYSVNDNLAPSSVQDILKASADPIADIKDYSEPGVKGMRRNSLVGDGRVNAHKAVKAAKEAKRLIHNDLFLRDVPMDWGETPSVQGNSYDYSPDIWVRRNQEDYKHIANRKNGPKYSEYKGYNSQDHQKPVYSKNPNWAYVEVRNRGYDTYHPNSHNSEVSLYWSIESGWSSWPDMWDGSETIKGTDQPVGNKIGTVSVPKLKPGESKILEFKWNIPDPDKINQNSICLLARIEDSPLGIKVHNGRLDRDVKKNNQIAMKNIDVHDLLPGNGIIVGVWDENMGSITHPHGSSTTFQNPTSSETDVDIEICTPENQVALTNEGEVTLTFADAEGWNIVKDEILNTDGIQVLEPGQVKLKEKCVRISNVSIPAETRFQAFIDVNMLSDQPSTRQSYEFNVRQYISSSNTYTGGGHHLVRINGGSIQQVGLPEVKEINKGEELTISPSLQTDDVNYKWYDSNHNFIARGSELSVAPSSTTEYYLEYISPAGYKDYEEIQVDVNQNIIEKVYPNPAVESVTVEYNIESPDSELELVLINNQTSNQSSYPVGANSSQVTLNVSNKSTGTYTISLQNNDEILDTKSLSITSTTAD